MVRFAGNFALTPETRVRTLEVDGRLISLNPLREPEVR